MMDSEGIKGFYEQYSDEIIKKRLESPDPIRRHAHRTEYESIIRLIPEGSSIADSGCGEGVIGLLLAERGISSTGADISEPNIVAAKAEAERRNVSERVSFVLGDAEHLPFNDKSFDVAISSHVLEHLPDFDQGARELVRVARKRVIVALPTCLNLSAASLLGGDYGFWKLTKRSPVALPWGILRILGHVFGEGVQEGYAGKDDLPHIFRYPWVMRRRLEKATGWKIVRFEASTLVFPYFQFLLPFTKWLENHKHTAFLRNFGYGSIAVLEPRTKE